VRGTCARKAGRCLSATDAPLHYRAYGSGAPVVLVHGMLGDFRAWTNQVDRFSTRFRTVAYSRRYHYPNSATGRELDYTVVTHAEDLAALIDALGLGPAHVVGSSYGAAVALALAGRRPEVVRSLALAEPFSESLLTMAGTPGAPLRATLAAVRAAFERGDTGEAIRSMIDGLNGAGTFEDLSDVDKQRRGENASALRAQLFSIDDDPSCSPEHLERITAPALLLTGELSTGAFNAIASGVAGSLTHAERMTIPGSSHAVHRGNPAAYNDAVLSFLAKH
jgi:pimeloyl-ACP methyl ester carboxylesterase